MLDFHVSCISRSSYELTEAATKCPENAHKHFPLGHWSSKGQKAVDTTALTRFSVLLALDHELDLMTLAGRKIRMRSRSKSLLGVLAATSGGQTRDHNISSSEGLANRPVAIPRALWLAKTLGRNNSATMLIVHSQPS